MKRITVMALPSKPIPTSTGTRYTLRNTATSYNILISGSTGKITELVDREELRTDSVASAIVPEKKRLFYI
jgi:hypothetical protein